MNKKFAAFFAGYGMSVNGNFAYGTMNGYETNATLNTFENVSPLKIHVSFYATDEQKQKIEWAIRNLKLKFFSMHFTAYGLLLGFNGMTLGSLLKRLPAVLNAIFEILSGNGALKKEFCPVCGKPLAETESAKHEIDGAQITIDNDCVERINSIISEENRDFENAPNNYLKGFLGAFLGGLAGVAVAVILYLLGVVSAISAIVSVVLGAFLYQKFQGKPNKGMIVIVSLTTLVMMAATVPAVYIIAAGQAAAELGKSFTAIEAFQICMADEEFARLFYCDLVLVLVFTLLGIGLEIYVLAKKIKRKKNIV